MSEMVAIAAEAELLSPSMELQLMTALRQMEYERLQARKERLRQARALGYHPSRRA